MGVVNDPRRAQLKRLVRQHVKRVPALSPGELVRRCNHSYANNGIAAALILRMAIRGQIPNVVVDTDCDPVALFYDPDGGCGVVPKETEASEATARKAEGTPRRRAEAKRKRKKT